MKTAMCAGLLCASPYILYQLFRFVSPALYVNERRYAVRVVGWGYVMFLTGVAISYFLIFPIDLPIFRDLSGRGRCYEHDFAAIIHEYIDTDVSGNGHCI